MADTRGRAAAEVGDPARPAFRLFRTTIADIDRASRPSLVRLRLVGDCLRHFGRAGLDQRIKLLFPPYDDGRRTHLPMPDLGPDEFDAPDGMVSLYRSTVALPQPPTWRTYTVRRIDPAGTELLVDLVLHGTTSPSARWLRAAEVGDELVVVGPDERSAQSRSGIEWAPGGAGRILLAGDETALPALAGIAESGTVRGDAEVCVVVEAPTDADLSDLAAPPGWDVRRVVRDETADVPGARLEREVRAFLAEHPGFLAPAPDAGADGAGRAASAAGARTTDEDAETPWQTADPAVIRGSYAWLAGEAGAVTRLRRHLVRDLGVDRRAVSFMGYWKLGAAAS